MIEATLITAIQSRTARVGVIGQGYVGLPLAAEFVRAEFSVTGVGGPGRLAVDRVTVEVRRRAAH